jgi:DNA polymerase-1
LSDVQTVVVNLIILKNWVTIVIKKRRGLKTMVVIIDGNHLACRNFFAIDPLTTSYGKEVQCIYGFLGSLRLLVKRFKDPDTYFFISWDMGGKTWRHNLDINYKGNRKPLSSDFREQLIDLRAILEYFDVQQCGIREIESDDIIGTITLKVRRLGHKVMIVSGDHDFEQLISNNVSVLSAHTSNKEVMKNVEYVRETYQMEPNLLVELMSLTGDPTDNIGGIDGVGDKTAISLLKANDGLDHLLGDIDNAKFYNKHNILVDVSDKLKEKIKNSIDKIHLANKLVRINCNVDLNIELKHKKNDFEKIKEEFIKLEFNKYLEKFDKWTSDFI